MSVSRQWRLYRNLCFYFYFAGVFPQAEKQKQAAVDLEKDYEALVNDSLVWMDKAESAYNRSYNEQKVRVT